MTSWRERAAAYYEATTAAIKSDLPVYLVVAAYVAAGAIYVVVNHGMVFGAIDIYARACFITYCCILPFVVLVCGVARITHTLDRRRGLAYRYMFGPRRVGRFIAGTLIMMGALLPFEAMFASVKSTFIDDHAPLDQIAADVDKAIHFGHGPVYYLYAIAKNEWVLRAIEANYDIVWFVICFGVFYWVAISPKANGVRMRYLAATFGVWVFIGNIVAGLVPTAGPAFYGLVTGDPSRFDKVRAFVQTTAGTFSSAADEQHYLWTLHASGVSGFGSGISAFLSIHVAQIALNALFIGEYSRRLGALAWAYVVLIMASSVYLGWHYGIDGYVAVVLTVAIYWALRHAFGAVRQTIPSSATAPAPRPTTAPAAPLPALREAAQ